MVDIKEVLDNLCFYDKRSSSDSNLDFDVYREREIGTNRICYCDNCFYGRTKLAEYILKLLNYEEI